MAAEAVVGFVIETLGNLLIEEAKFLTGVSDQVEDLQLEVARLRSFLREAEARQNEHNDIRVWISQSRDFAYEAEDLLEGYAFRIASQRENILKRTACFLKECYFRRSIGSDIQKLKSKISSLTRSFLEYGIRPFDREREGSSSTSPKQIRRTYSHVVEDDFIKLDDDVEMLVGHLVNENETDLHGVVSIYGMGGLGKTTLARKVYNHHKVTGYFYNLVWVCISQQWQKTEILQGILIKFLPHEREEIKKWGDDELIGKVYKTLRETKCLVVLDDIWSIDAWESIKEAFPFTKGSKLLLTTRNRGVALQIDPNGFHHQPRLLSDLESWELLQIKALRKRTCIEMQEMEKLGKEMVKHCGGLPLAVVVLGGILATKRDIKEWETIHRNVKAHIGRGKNIAEPEGEVKKILALSYNDLPPKLKACFLYLGRFPEDSDIDVERLYQLWIAEGMISVKDNEESMLDVAERHLEELAERSMVQVKVDEDLKSITRFHYCRLHDLLRDLSLEKAKEENFFSFVHSRNGFDDEVYKSSSSTHQIHRLVIHFQEDDVPKYVPPQKRITKHLRSLSFLVEGGYYWGPMARKIKSQFSCFRMLRVLEIQGLHFDLPRGMEFCFHVIDYLDLPEDISNLIHLRYLSLRGCLSYTLPSSLGNLIQLQTLDLRDAADLMIPNILWKLRQLKYLYLPDYNYWRIFGGHKLRLDGLNRLEILHNFDTRLCSSKDLVKLTNLRQLRGRIDDVKCDVIVEIIRFISNSKSLLKPVDLCIIFPEDIGTTENWSADIITKLFSSTKLLTIVNHFGNLPKYEAGFASELVYLSVQKSKLEDDPMETLERLPNLKFLEIEESFLGTEMQCCAAGFPQLRTLKFSNLLNLQKWIIAEGAMPNLSSITIWSCGKLEMIPDGLRFITTLESLYVFGMPEEFNRRLQVIDGQEGGDVDKIRHVPRVRVYPVSKIGCFKIRQCPVRTCFVPLLSMHLNRMCRFSLGEKNK